jgi:hypothetical protein
MFFLSPCIVKNIELHSDSFVLNLGHDSTEQRSAADALGFRPKNVTQEMVRFPNAFPFISLPSTRCSDLVVQSGAIRGIPVQSLFIHPTLPIVFLNLDGAKLTEFLE